jgi:uncharacterized protein YqeY
MTAESTLKLRLSDETKQAMRDKDKDKLSVLRMIHAAIRQKEIDERIDLTDVEVVAILQKLDKQRKESIAQYQAGNRPDLVAKEQSELVVIHSFLPQQMSENELSTLVKATISELQATSVKDMGKLMAALKTKLQGRADMQLVNQLVKQLLNA